MVLEERIPTERLPVYILRHACSLLGPMGVRSIQMTWKRRSRSGGNRCRVGGDRARTRLVMDDGSHRKALLSRSSRPLGRSAGQDVRCWLACDSVRSRQSTAPRRQRQAGSRGSRGRLRLMSSVGERLGYEREVKNKTIEEIGVATGIRLSYLEALERNEFHALPGRAFGKLYIRAYAEILGFDPQPLIDQYDREQRQSRRPSTGSSPPGPEPSRRVETAIASRGGTRIA